MSLLHRRAFLYSTCGLAGAAGLSAVSWMPDEDRSLAGHTISPGGSVPLRAVRTSGRALGTQVHLTALHRDEKLGMAALRAAFAELELVEQLMSIYRPDSQVSRLNRYGFLDDPHPLFVQILLAAQAMSRRTEGAFDVTIQPLWAVYQEAKKAGVLPSAVAVEEARRKVDWRRVELSSRRVSLQEKGMAVTLNGIAQGFAADRVVHTLRSYGVQHALIDTGEIGTFSVEERGKSWTIGVQHPRHPEAYVSLVRLCGRCLATSGDYATTFSSDFRHHHIFDPQTGASPQALSSASVLAPTAMEADALSTALFVMNPADGVRLVRATQGADALLVFKDGRSWKSDGFARIETHGGAA